MIDMINIKIISILTIILLIAGCIENQTTIEPCKTSESTISETSQRPEITVTLNDLTKVTFLKDNYPDKGNIYIIANISLKNNGYENFHLNSPGLRLVYNNISYENILHNSRSPEYIFDTNIFPLRVDILNGGTITGNCLFELPENTNGYTVRYEGTAQNLDENMNYIPYKW